MAHGDGMVVAGSSCYLVEKEFAVVLGVVPLVEKMLAMMILAQVAAAVAVFVVDVA